LPKEIVVQHPAGTSINVEAATLLKFSTAAGVLIVRELAIPSPLIRTANSIGSIAAPVERATLA
jgi:hypothetical protein